MTGTLSYAAPENQRAKPSTVGFLLGLLGVALIFLSGCFMIGIMIVLFAQVQAGAPQTGTPASRMIFAVVLYVFAFASFGGGAVILVQAVKKLMQS